MRAKLERHTNILIYTSIISLTCAAYILFKVNADMVRTLNVFHTPFETIHFLIGFSHLFLLLFHLYALIVLFMFLRQYSGLKLFTKMMLFFTVISLFSMGVEKVMIDEIARQYRHGMDTSEMALLNLAYLVNVFFILLMFIFLFRAVKTIKLNDVKHVAIDEEFFIIGQWLGIFSGMAGLMFTLDMIHFVNRELLVRKLWVFIPFYIMFLTPYALALSYWFITKRKQDIHRWLDEKQIQDILKSSFSTLLLSIPGLAVLLLFQLPHAMFLIINYVFLILILFSVGTLYFYKLKDS